jgi:hypothetical protein
LFELVGHPGYCGVGLAEVGFELVLLGLEQLDLLPLTLARVVCGETIPLYTLDAALLLLVLGLGALAGRQAGLWLGEHLAPGLALLGRLAVLVRRVGEAGVRGRRERRSFR